QHLGPHPIGAEDEQRALDARRHRHHAAESAHGAASRAGAGALDGPRDPLPGPLGAREVDPGVRVELAAHASGSAAGTWVRSTKAATRCSTAARSTPSNPFTPNPCTAKPPIAAP